MELESFKAGHETPFVQKEFRLVEGFREWLEDVSQDRG